jgi:hypothetical protein
MTGGYAPHQEKRLPQASGAAQINWDMKLDPDGAPLAEFRGPDPSGAAPKR